MEGRITMTSKELQNKLQKDGGVLVGNYLVRTTKYRYEIWRENNMLKEFGKYCTGFYSLCDYLGIDYA